MKLSGSGVQIHVRMLTAWLRKQFFAAFKLVLHKSSLPHDLHELSIYRIISGPMSATLPESHDDL
jgi:hypothetical protein